MQNEFYFISGSAQKLVTTTSLIATIYLINKRKIPKLYIIFPVYSIASGFFDLLVFIISTYGDKLKSDNGQFQINTFTAFEFFLFTYYLNAIIKSKTAQLYSLIAIGVFTAVLIYTMRYLGLHELFTHIIVIENILLSIFCGLFYLKLFAEMVMINPAKKADFWIVTGMLFYFTITTPYYFFFRNLSINSQQFLYVINAIGNICMHLLIIRGFLCFQAKK